jgi:CBS domain-containing protein
MVNDYFLKLGEKICSKLNDIGYSYCKGNIMAKNPQWCKPVSEWEKYFAGWVATPEPQNLLDAMIFFDFRNAYGNEALTDRLRKTVSFLIDEHPVFLFHVASDAYNTKSQQITSVVPDKSTEMIDLKAAINLITRFARTYSLKNKFWCTNTVDRLNAIKTMKVVSENTIDEILFSYNILMKLRLKNQVEQIDGNLPLSNLLNTKKLLEIEWSLLKKVLSLFPSYQNKINDDFRVKS